VEKVVTGAEGLNGHPGDHVVLFYRDEDELAEWVSDHVLAGTFSGGTAIVIATAAHRRAIAGRCADTGVDIDAARASRSYIELDAEETLRKLVVGDWPNAATFWQVISPLIRKAAISGPVHVFGEVVALLWNAGLINAAIDLEALWNELRLQYPFVLLCGYSLHDVTAYDHQDALNEVCRAHATVVGEAPELA
jgi:hypothetical protein